MEGLYKVGDNCILNAAQRLELFLEWFSGRLLQSLGVTTLVTPDPDSVKPVCQTCVTHPRTSC